MAARTDWRATQEFIARRIKTRLEDPERPMSIAELAGELGVPENRVKNWLYLRTRFDPSYLVPLADVLEEAPETLAADLGFVSREYALAGQRIVELQREIDALNERVFAATQRSEGIAHTLAGLLAALDVDEFPNESTSCPTQLTVRPWLEGVGHYRVRTGDYVLLERSDGDALSVEDLSEDVSNVLRDAGATQFSMDSTWPERWRERSSRALLYVVPRLNVPRAAQREPRMRRPSTVAIVSTTTSSWTSHVVSLVAAWIGYASTTTMMVSRLTFGDHILHGPGDSRRPTRPGEVARRLLSDPPPDLVWGHDRLDAVGAVIEALEALRRDTFVVYLRPTDRLHEHTVHRPVQTNPPLHELEERRRSLDRLVRNGEQSLVLDVDFPRNLNPRDPLDTDARDQLMLRSMVLARQIIGALPVITTDGDLPNIPEGFRRFMEDANEGRPETLALIEEMTAG